MERAFEYEGEMWVATITGGAHGVGNTPNPSMSWTVEFRRSSNPADEVVYGSLPSCSFEGETDENLAARLQVSLGNREGQ